MEKFAKESIFPSFLSSGRAPNVAYSTPIEVNKCLPMSSMRVGSGLKSYAKLRDGLFSHSYQQVLQVNWTAHQINTAKVKFIIQVRWRPSFTYHNHHKENGYLQKLIHTRNTISHTVPLCFCFLASHFSFLKDSFRIKTPRHVLSPLTTIYFLTSLLTCCAL